MRTRRERDHDRAAGIDGITGFGDVAHQRLEILFAADSGEMDTLAIHGDFELTRELDTLHCSEVRSEQRDIQMVLAIERRQETLLPATHGPDGHARHLDVL